jgi:hypothetical protein
MWLAGREGSLLRVVLPPLLHAVEPIDERLILAAQAGLTDPAGAHGTLQPAPQRDIARFRVILRPIGQNLPARQLARRLIEHLGKHFAPFLEIVERYATAIGVIGALEVLRRRDARPRR